MTLSLLTKGAHLRPIPTEAALQGEAPNSHKLLRSKAAVVNVMVKRRDTNHVM